MLSSWGSDQDISIPIIKKTWVLKLRTKEEVTVMNSESQMIMIYPQKGVCIFVHCNISCSFSFRKNFHQQMEDMHEDGHWGGIGGVYAQVPILNLSIFCFGKSNLGPFIVKIPHCEIFPTKVVLWGIYQKGREISHQSLMSVFPHAYPPLDGDAFLSG